MLNDGKSAKREEVESLLDAQNSLAIKDKMVRLQWNWLNNLAIVNPRFILLEIMQRHVLKLTRKECLRAAGAECGPSPFLSPR